MANIVSRFPRAAGGLLASAALLLIAGACRDIIGPDESTRRTDVAPAPLTYTAPSDSAFLARESPASVSRSISVSGNGSVSGSGNLGITWHYQTVYAMSITGQVVQTPSSTKNKQPGSIFGVCAPNQPRVRFSRPFAYWLHEWAACGYGPTSFAYASGYAEFLLSPYSTGNCSGYTSSFDPCWSYSGGYQLSMTRLSGQLVVSPVTASIPVGGTATVTWKATPDSLGQWRTPFTVVKTFYQPDYADGGVASDTAKQCADFGGGCRISPDGSGWLHVWAMVNGSLKKELSYIDVPGLIVSADPMVVRAGDTVVFTMGPEDGVSSLSAERWAWVPRSDVPLPGLDSGSVACAPGSRTCRRPVFVSGTMNGTANVNGKEKSDAVEVVAYATLSLVADQSQVMTGDSVLFTATMDGRPWAVAEWRWRTPAGPEAPGCELESSTCTHSPSVTGVMVAYTAQRKDSATAAVNVGEQFVLTAMPDVAASGDTVTFRATLNGVPEAPTRWRWRPAVGGWKDVDCAGAHTCRLRVLASGEMWVYRNTAGGEDSTSARVTVESSDGGSEGSGGDGDGGAKRGAACGPNDLCGYARLRVILEGGLAGTFSAGDTLLQLGSSVPFSYSAQPGYRGMAAFVDTRYAGPATHPFELTSIFGTVTMDRDRVLSVAADSVLTGNPQVEAIREKLREFLTTATPDAYVAYLEWLLSIESTFPSPAAFAGAISQADYLEADPRHSSEQLERVHANLQRRAFGVQSTGRRTSLYQFNVDSVDGPVLAEREVGAEPSRQRDPAAGTVFIYVNGIVETEPGAREVQLLLRTLLGAGTRNAAEVTYYWNTNIPGRWSQMDKVDRCIQLVPRDLNFRNPYIVLAALSVCLGTTDTVEPFIVLLRDDLKDSMQGYMALYSGDHFLSDDGLGVLRMMTRLRQRGATKIVGITHSEGNMVFSSAARQIKEDRGSSQTYGCLAAFSAASPIQKRVYHLPDSLVVGRTVESDILLQVVVPPTDFPRVKNTNYQLNWARWIESSSAYTGDSPLSAIVRLVAGYPLHGMVRNYIQDSTMRSIMHDAVWAVHSRCREGRR